MWTLALAFLKSNWKLVAVGVFSIGVLTYITVIKAERDHYKSEYQETKLNLNKLIASSKAEEERLKNENDAITAKYHSTLTDANALVTVNAKLNEENIKNAKELRSVKLSLDAVRLFNASKQSVTKDDKPAAAVSGNDEAAASTAKALEEKSQTLADLLLVVNENDSNHIKCIKTVTEWQNFWLDYVKVVNAGQR